VVVVQKLMKRLRTQLNFGGGIGAGAGPGPGPGPGAGAGAAGAGAGTGAAPADNRPTERDNAITCGITRQSQAFCTPP